MVAAIFRGRDNLKQLAGASTYHVVTFHVLCLPMLNKYFLVLKRITCRSRLRFEQKTELSFDSFSGIKINAELSEINF